MTGYWSSTTEITDNLLASCESSLKTTTRDVGRAMTIDVLGKSVSALEAFVRGYESIEDSSISTDGEILNWAFSETSTDFCSAIWLLASGFYKASASSLRNAFDIATASLYFQIRENTDPGPGAYNRFFAEWDRGDRQTPNWGEMKQFISMQPSVERFKTTNGFDMVDISYDHFKYLCAYTHTSAFANNGDPITAINTTGVAPLFEETYFTRGCELTAKTVSIIALLWQVVFPKILETEPLGPVSSGVYSRLFLGPHGPLVIAHK